jgi:hypothetical protein
MNGERVVHSSGSAKTRKDSTERGAMRTTSSMHPRRLGWPLGCLQQNTSDRRGECVCVHVAQETPALRFRTAAHRSALEDKGKCVERPAQQHLAANFHEVDPAFAGMATESLVDCQTLVQPLRYLMSAFVGDVKAQWPQDQLRDRD